MSAILFDAASNLFYQPLSGQLSHIWLTPTKEGDEDALIELNNILDIGGRSFFAPYPYTVEHAKAWIARGVVVSEPLITAQVKQEGKLVQKDLPLSLLDVLRDSRTMKAVRPFFVVLFRQLILECIALDWRNRLLPASRCPRRSYNCFSPVFDNQISGCELHRVQVAS